MGNAVLHSSSSSPKNYWTTRRWWFRRMNEKVLDRQRIEKTGQSFLFSEQEMDDMMRRLRTKSYLTPSMNGKYIGLALITLLTFCAIVTTLDYRRHEEYLAALSLEESSKYGKLSRITAETHNNSHHERPRIPQDFRRF
nr:unnamed protein product [Naegleria fowleri]